MENSDAIDAPVNPDLSTAIVHPERIPPKKVTLKLNRCKDARRVLLNKKKLK